MLPLNFSGQNTATNKAVLALADGTVFTGISVGANGHCVAEIVFNTLMSGHQEVITDPTYSNQIVAFTYPHVGNTGVNDIDSQSNKAQISGIVMRDCSLVVSNFRSTKSLPEYLQKNNIVAISDIDTRKLTRIIRESGQQTACIMVGDDAEKAVQLAQQGLDNSENNYQSIDAVWDQGSLDLFGQPINNNDTPKTNSNVVVYDLGVKQGLLRTLVDQGCKVTVVAENTSSQQILELKPDAIIVSSGAGNPNNRNHAIQVCKQLIGSNTPMLGIGLGCQVLALASGATVEKLKTGNHGCNHPIKNLETNRVFISTQKQDYGINQNSLSTEIKQTYVSLFDNSVQGFQLKDQPVFGLQAYPEASPGSNDLNHIFDQFFSL